jgi:hypothetical protein
MQRAYVTRRPGIVIQGASDFRDQDSQIRVGDERVRPELFVQLPFESARGRTSTRAFNNSKALGERWIGSGPRRSWRVSSSSVNGPKENITRFLPQGIPRELAKFLDFPKAFSRTTP